MNKAVVFSFLILGISTAWSQADSVCNPSFETGLTDWQNFANNGAVATFDTSAVAATEGAVGVVIDIQDVSVGTCVLSACIADMYANQTYRMSFWAKSDNAVEVLATISKASPGYNNYASANVVLSSDWVQYEISGSVADDLLSDVRLAKFKFLSEGTVMIDDIQIDILELTPEICQGNFEVGLDAWAVNQNNGSIAADLDVNEFAEGTQSARLTVNVEDGSPIFSSCSSYMPGATSLMVHFSAKSDVNGAVLEAKTALQAAPYTVFGDMEASLTEEWQEFTFTSYSEEEINGVRLAKFAFQSNGVFWIDDVWFEEVPPTPVVCNGDFESALDAWTVSVSEDAEATVAATPATSFDGVVCAYAEVTSPGAAPSSVQLSSCRAGAVQDSTYVVSVWVKGTEPGLAFNVSTAYADAPYQTLHAESFVTDTEWTEYCWEFTADSTVYDALRVVKIQFLETGTYYIDGAALQPLGHVCSSDTQSLNQEQIISEVSCFPNPVRQKLHVNIPVSWGVIEANLLSGSGQHLKRVAIQGQTTIDMQFLAPGFYFLVLNGKEGQRVTKAIQVTSL